MSDSHDDPSDVGLLGRVIAGKYRIDARIGGGGMGAVFRAQQLGLDRAVALKVLHREVRRDPQFTFRFKREAKAASRLEHQNLVRVLDFGAEPDGLLYMVMELLDGRDLFALHEAEFPLPPQRIANVLAQVLAALGVAHEAGVIHRDLKPENIMVLRGTDDEGRPCDVVKVCDFGIAKLVEGSRAENAESRDGRLSTHGLLVGTPEYMSPEQCQGHELDARSDLYSVGVILFRLLTGKLPFVAENAIGVVLKHVTEAPTRPSELRPDVDPRLEAIAIKAMQKEKDARFRSAREMRAALRPLFESDPGWSNPDLPAYEPAEAASIERAATVALAADAGSSGRFSVPASSRPRDRRAHGHAIERKATLSGAEIDDEPLSIAGKRSPWPLAAALLVAAAAAGTVGAWSLRRVQPPEASAASEPAPSTTAMADAREPATPAEPLPVASASARPSPRPSGSRVAPAARSLPPQASSSSAPPTAPTASAAERIDVASARVSVASVRAEKATSAAVVAAVAIDRATACYRAALREPAAKGRAFRQQLQLKTDAAGAITFAAMPAPDFLASLQLCYVQKLIGARVEGASDAAATVDLDFTPR